MNFYLEAVDRSNETHNMIAGRLTNAFMGRSFCGAPLKGARVAREDLPPRVKILRRTTPSRKRGILIAIAIGAALTALRIGQ